MKEVFGKLLAWGGLLVVKFGVLVANVGFYLMGVSRDKAAGVLASMWPVEWTIQSPVVRIDNLKGDGSFSRAGGED